MALKLLALRFNDKVNTPPALPRAHNDSSKSAHPHMSASDRHSWHLSSRKAVNFRKLYPITEVQPSYISRWSSSTASTLFVLSPRSPIFHYYLPHISTSSSDFYTCSDWAVSDMREANEQAETEALLAEDYANLDLPYIGENDFNYYPSPVNQIADEPQDGSEDMERVSTKEDRLIIRALERRGRAKTLEKKKHWEEFWLEKKVTKLLRRLHLKK